MPRNRRRGADDGVITVPQSVVDKLDSPLDADSWQQDVREVHRLLRDCGSDDPSGALADAGWRPETALRRLLGAPPREGSAVR